MIDKDMIITDFLKQYPDQVHILTEAGFPCIGCFFADGETLEMGCLEVGIDVYDLIDKINEEIASSNMDIEEEEESEESSFSSGVIE